MTDIPKLLEVHEELADFASQYSNTPTDDILELLMGLDHVYGTIQLLGILLKREGPDFKLREGFLKVVRGGHFSLLLRPAICTMQPTLQVG